MHATKLRRRMARRLSDRLGLDRRGVSRVLRALPDSELETFESLTPQERKLLLDSMSAQFLGGEDPADALVDVDYHRRPVDMYTFLHDPRYLGSVLFPPDAPRVLYPKREDQLLEIFAPDSTIQQVVFTGSIGGGKTFTATIIQLYVLYLLSCLRQPQVYHGLAPNSVIGWGLFNVFKYKVETTSFHVLKQFVDASPYFKEHFPRDPKVETTLKFPHYFRVLSGANEIHALGENLIAVLIDEADFMRAGLSAGERGQAYKLHASTTRRMKSRFLRGGRVPGVSCLVSSKQTSDGYVETFIEEHRDDPTVFVADNSLWDVKPGSYSKKTFPVLVGTGTYASRVLDEGEVIEDLKARIVHVPIDFRRDFEQATDEALMDIAGVSVASSFRFISDRQSIEDAVDPSREHPFTRAEVTIDFRKKDTLEDFFVKKALLHTAESRFRPRVNPTEARFIHVDLSLSKDCAGIAMGHVSGSKVVERTNEDGSASQEVSPIIYFDFVLRIRPPRGSQTDLAGIRQFVVMLGEYGFPIRKVTFDGYQSASLVQELIKQGFDAGLYSMDRVDPKIRHCEGYVHLRSALSDRRVSFYRSPALMDELVHLEEREVQSRGIRAFQVDHPMTMTTSAGTRERGSKDLADPVGAVVSQIMLDETIVAQAPSRAGGGPPVRRVPLPPSVDDHSWLLDGPSKNRIVGIVS